MFNNELYDKVYVRDLMTIPPSYIDKRENIETVMETFRKTGAWNLPVLDNGLLCRIYFKIKDFYNLPGNVNSVFRRINIINTTYEEGYFDF